jgi:hypothetical protein
MFLYDNHSIKNIMTRLTEDQIESIRSDILLDLLKRRKIGNSHTSFDNIQKGFPSDQRRDVKSIAEDLLNERFLIPKPTGYGREVSINPSRISEILEMPLINQACNDDPFLEQRIKKYLK